MFDGHYQQPEEPDQQEPARKQSDPNKTDWFAVIGFTLAVISGIAVSYGIFLTIEFVISVYGP